MIVALELPLAAGASCAHLAMYICAQEQSTRNLPPAQSRCKGQAHGMQPKDCTAARAVQQIRAPEQLMLMAGLVILP